MSTDDNSLIDFPIWLNEHLLDIEVQNFIYSTQPIIRHLTDYKLYLRTFYDTKDGLYYELLKDIHNTLQNGNNEPNNYNNDYIKINEIANETYKKIIEEISKYSDIEKPLYLMLLIQKFRIIQAQSTDQTCEKIIKEISKYSDIEKPLYLMLLIQKFRIIQAQLPDFLKNKTIDNFPLANTPDDYETIHHISSSIANILGYSKDSITIPLPYKIVNEYWESNSYYYNWDIEVNNDYVEPKNEYYEDDSKKINQAHLVRSLKYLITEKLNKGIKGSAPFARLVYYLLNAKEAKAETDYQHLSNILTDGAKSLKADTERSRKEIVSKLYDELLDDKEN